MAEKDERPHGAAGGPKAVLATLRHARRAGLRRTVPALARVNQAQGFDCPGCAWPESPRRGRIEFCENGAKAVAHETTHKLVGRVAVLLIPRPMQRE